MVEYTLTIRMPSGAGVCFMGRLLRIRLQLHNSLAILVEGIQIINGAFKHMYMILGTDVFYPRGGFLCLCRWGERVHHSGVDIEAIETGIIYELIAAWLQSQRNLGPSVYYTNGEEGGKEVGFHVQVCAVLSDDIWAFIKE